MKGSPGSGSVRVQLQEGVQRPVVPARKANGCIQHADADAVAGFSGGGRVGVLAIAHQEVALVVDALLIGEAAVQNEGQLCSAMGMLRDAATGLDVIQGNLVTLQPAYAQMGVTLSQSRSL